MTDLKPDIDAGTNGHNGPSEDRRAAWIEVELPADRARLGTPPLRTASVTFAIPEARSGTPASGPATHLAGYAAFLLTVARYSGSDSVTVHTASGSGRVELTGADTVAGLVERLGHDLDGSRPSAHSPLVVASGATPDLSARSGAAELVLSLWPGASGGEIRYAADLWDEAWAAAFAGHFVEVLRQAVADPGLRLDQVELLSDQERELLLRQWNGPVAGPDTTVVELIGRQARTRGDAVAVVSAGVELTFEDLDARANRLAHHLIGLGVGPEVVVGVCLERSADTVVALLGILKAGGAYLPLDPAYPADRLAFMLDDAQTRVVLTTVDMEAALPLGGGVDVVLLDEDEAVIAARPDISPGVRITPRSLAYIIYTSGSSGAPKGVMVEHGGLANLAITQARGFGLDEPGPPRRVLQYASLNFDASVSEIFVTLCAGCTLVVTGESPIGDELLTMLRRYGISTVTLPSFIAAALPRDDPDSCPDVIVSAGDRCSGTWFRSYSADRVAINGYGPTETTVCATMFSSREEPPPSGDIPIGRPLANVRVYVLDEAQRLVPVGVPGEICIGGAGVARGYVGRADLTAQRFLDDPFVPGGRMYRTGDIGRWRRDGNLEFLGRLDDQVKIRGFRVEVAEVETVLKRLPGVTEAVVMPWETDGERRLVAYAVAPREPVSIIELRAHARAALPDYMVPSAFVILDALPLNRHGKVDRGRLPAPDTGRPEQASTYVAPRNPVERALCEIWQDVLDVATVGIDDLFIDLGGHSLLAAQIADRVRDMLGVEVPLAAVFDVPTVRGLAAMLAVSGTPVRPPVRRVTEEGELVTLSSSQRRLWFLDKLVPGNPFYVACMALRFAGPLDAQALSVALTGLTQRHHALRTVFVERGGDPYQLVLPATTIPVRVVDSTEDHARALAREQAATPFDITSGPLIRATLARLSPREHLLVLSMHHIVADGWSWGIALQELAHRYAAQRAGISPDLPELPVQYTDYAVWHGEHTAGRLHTELAYWRAQLAELPTVELPTERPRPAIASYRARHVGFAIPPEIAASLPRVCVETGVTTFMVTLAAFLVVLSRHSGQHDLAVGTPVAGRTRMEVEDLIGMFVNTLVLRVDLSGDPTFTELLDRVKRVVVDAQNHQDLPFEHLIEDLNPPRDMSRNPLVQILFQTLDEPVEVGMPMGDATLLSYMDPGSASPMDLVVGLWAAADGTWSGDVMYAADLWDEPWAAALAGHFVEVLRQVVADPARRVDRIELLSDPERDLLLRQWNGPVAVPETTVLELIGRQVNARPDAVAVAGALTYQELAVRANRLAHHLIGLGVGPEVVVGVCLDRSPQMVTTLLGILKAGGAYLPLDPAHPAGRLAYLLNDAQARVVVTDAAHRAALPVTENVAAVLVDEDAAVIAAQPDTDPDVPITPQSLAYVLYTSGSTGNPKGVMLEHQSAWTVTNWMQDHFQFGPEDRILQKTSITFDVSIWEIFWPLSAGGQIVLLEPGREADPVHIAEVLDRERVTFANFVPSMLKHFLTANAATVGPHLRVTFAGGEALSGDLRDAFFRQSPSRLFNLYGPTESSITYWECRRDDTDPAIPIGRPLANVRVYVLDEAQRLVPVGVPGEICIGGAGVARGYVGRADLTAQRFLDDPFVPGGRMYRTGDIGRWRRDGNLEFLGRLDDQVKIRGFRVEVAEVETVLKRLPGVTDAVVTPWRTDGDVRLAAYVAAAQRPPSAGQLRAHVRAALPDYMVPSAFVVLDALPLNRHGKVDRGRLPAPDTGRPEQASTYVAPRTPVERALCQLWQDVLGVPTVGVEDSFFDLGGHSLLAAQIAARVRDVLGVELPLTALFRTPTVAGVAAAMATPGGPTIPPVRRVTEEGELVALSSSQRRLWFLDKLVPGNPFYVACMALRFAGPLDAQALSVALTGLTQRHHALRTVFVERGGEPYQLVLPATTIPVPVVDLSDLPAEQAVRRAKELARQEAATPFDLADSVRPRAMVLRLAPDHQVLVVSIHHIVADGWSWRVALQELAHRYAAQLAGVAPDLPELPIQFPDYSIWQAEREAQQASVELAYWRDQLAGMSTLELPTDRPRPAATAYVGTGYDHPIPPEIATALPRVCAEAGATTFMVTLAAFLVVLSRHSGQRDIAVGTPISGRGTTQVEDLVGMFVNNLVLRVDLSGDPTFGELLDRVKRVVTDAQNHQDLPFDRLVEDLRPPRDLSRNPLIPVIFSAEEDAFDASMTVGTGLGPAPLVNTWDATAHVHNDLHVAVLGRDTGMIVTFRYSTELWDEPSMARMAGHLVEVLRQAIADPGRRVDRIELLSGAERELLLRQWNGPVVAPDSTVLDLIGAQVRARAGEVAIVEAGSELTFGQLDVRANRLAHHLIGLGVGPEVVVGVCLDRSADTVVALLGILKAGGVYLPLDPGYPVHRLAYMLDDARAGAVVTNTTNRSSLPSGDTTSVVMLETVPPGPDVAPDVAVTPEMLAYIIYTSGSTGTPKGVMVEHGSLRNFGDAVVATEYGPRRRLAFTANTSFDASFSHLLGLCYGSTLVVIPEEVRRDPVAFVEAAAEQAIDAVDCTPSQLSAWISAGLLDGGAAVSSIVLGGEEVNAALWRRLSRLAGCRCLNMYGPTEVTIDATFAAIAPGTTPSIGKPFASVRVYVLDEAQRLVPVGVAGEICVGGVGVARGYVGRAELTAQRFLDDPFVPGGRMYRTGDIGRWRRDGNLEFLGRRDDQLKIRGFRVEAAEIETVLKARPGIDEALVVSLTEDGGPAGLVAYVSGPSLPSPAEARAWCAGMLPAYMVPQFIVAVDKWPLTANGKVDRDKLPAPGAVTAPGSGAAVAPRTDTEVRCAAILARLLGLAGVGITDNFFDLGGHSLMAVQLAATLTEAFRTELPTRLVFERPTVEGLAAALDAMLVSGHSRG